MNASRYNGMRPRSKHEVTAHLSSVLQVSLQGSHKKMAKSILKPFWVPFEIKITFARVNRSESINIKKSIPSGFVLKKVGDLPRTLEGYREVIISRLPGQSISMYPAAEFNVQDLIKDFYVVPYKEAEEGERRKSNLVKFRVLAPECWIVSTYENAEAHEHKVEGKDISNTIQKIYAAMLAGEKIEERVNEALKQFNAAYSDTPDAELTEADLMPAHRMSYINLKLLEKIARQENE